MSKTGRKVIEIMNEDPLKSSEIIDGPIISPTPTSEPIDPRE